MEDRQKLRVDSPTSSKNIPKIQDISQKWTKKDHLEPKICLKGIFWAKN